MNKYLTSFLIAVFFFLGLLIGSVQSPDQFSQEAIGDLQEQNEWYQKNFEKLSQDFRKLCKIIEENDLNYSCAEKKVEDFPETSLPYFP
jgi:hypothetical protein